MSCKTIGLLALAALLVVACGEESSPTSVAEPAVTTAAPTGDPARTDPEVASEEPFVIEAAGLINFVVAQHGPGLDLNVLLLLNNVFLMVGAICLFVIGLELYQGRRELVPEDSSG